MLFTGCGRQLVELLALLAPWDGGSLHRWLSLQAVSHGASRGAVCSVRQRRNALPIAHLQQLVPPATARAEFSQRENY
jgi:hypothetical protein